MSITGNLSAFAQNASGKMKDTTEMMKISGQITNNEKALNDLYIAVGKAYCANPNAESHPELNDYVLQVQMLEQQNQSLQAQYTALKGIVICPQCQAQVKAGTPFCSICGYRFPYQPKKVCLNCGSSLTEEQRFCTVCGTPVPTSQAVPLPSSTSTAAGAGTTPQYGGTAASFGAATTSADGGMKACPHCGQMVRADLQFCKFCGSSIV